MLNIFIICTRGFDWNQSECRKLYIYYGSQFESYVTPYFFRWPSAAIEEQAVHRCHRIGQGKEVTVLKYVMKDTVEEKLTKLYNVVSEEDVDKTQDRSVSLPDLLNVLKWQAIQNCVTAVNDL